MTFIGWEPAEGAVQPFVLTDGRWHTSDAEAVFDRGLARLAEIEIGDAVEIASGPLRRIYTVTGFGTPTMRAPYPLWDPALVVLTVSAIDDLAEGSRAFVVGLKLPGGRDAALGAVRAANLAARGASRATARAIPRISVLRVV